MYEYGDSVYIIDQHAAHERLIFNRLKDGMANRSVITQPMLVPYVLNLNALEYAFIRENLDNIRSMGFDIDEFGGNSYKVSAVPIDLQKIDLSAFFNDILGEMNGFRAIKLEDILKDKLATAACKAAVKGGMDLTQAEIDELFKLMDGNMGLKCPHGRPVVVKLTKTELEKMFKRIV
jgi:DNA mismatch repair protein MutL